MIGIFNEVLSGAKYLVVMMKLSEVSAVEFYGLHFYGLELNQLKSCLKNIT